MLFQTRKSFVSSKTRRFVTGPIDCQTINTVKAQKSIWFERKQRIRAVQLTQKSERSLCPVDILQNGATLTYRRLIVE